MHKFNGIESMFSFSPMPTRYDKIMAGGQGIEDAINRRLKLLAQSEIPLMISEMKRGYKQAHESVIGPILSSPLFYRLTMERFATTQTYLDLEDIKQISRQSTIDEQSFLNNTFCLETLNGWLLLNSLNDSCIVSIDGFNNTDLKCFSTVFTIQHPDYSAHINGELRLAEGDISFNTKRLSLSWQSFNGQPMINISGWTLTDNKSQPFSDFSDDELAPFKMMLATQKRDYMVSEAIDIFRVNFQAFACARAILLNPKSEDKPLIDAFLDSIENSINYGLTTTPTYIINDQSVKALSNADFVLNAVKFYCTDASNFIDEGSFSSVKALLTKIILKSRMPFDGSDNQLDIGYLKLIRDLMNTVQPESTVSSAIFDRSIIRKLNQHRLDIDDIDSCIALGDFIDAYIADGLTPPAANEKDIGFIDQPSNLINSL
tara:strand:+ start:64962 stop:66254 length:1293 start_codon:yes stop_codon:yes gene_type:complete